MSEAVQTTQEATVEQNHDLTNENPDQLRNYYSQMLLIRRFEERTGEMYTRAKIGGYCHLNLGEEATIVGLMAALEADDYIYTNYREHGYILARGIPPNRIMAELFGKQTGVSRGRGGSMHMFHSKAHFMGGYGIVGGQIPLAVGAAFALKYKQEPGVVVCQMGDSTTNIGAWHESLNIAQLYKLPVIFYVVNNGYGMGTKVEAGSAEPELFQKSCAYRMYGERVDGRDMLAVRDTIRKVRKQAQEDGQPALIEAVSYRFRGHSVVDPARYRPQEEVERERADDPLQRYARLLQEARMVDEGWFDMIAEQVERDVTEAIEYADSSPDPVVDDLFTNVYATPVSNFP